LLRVAPSFLYFIIPFGKLISTSSVTATTAGFIQRFNIQKYKPGAMPFAPSTLLFLLKHSILDILRFDIQKRKKNIEYPTPNKACPERSRREC
jgi:hypothetical protein